MVTLVGCCGWLDFTLCPTVAQLDLVAGYVAPWLHLLRGYAVGLVALAFGLDWLVGSPHFTHTGWFTFAVAHTHTDLLHYTDCLWLGYGWVGLRVTPHPFARLVTFGWLLRCRVGWLYITTGLYLPHTCPTPRCYLPHTHRIYSLGWLWIPLALVGLQDTHIHTHHTHTPLDLPHIHFGWLPLDLYGYAFTHTPFALGCGLPTQFL